MVAWQNLRNNFDRDISKFRAALKFQYFETDKNLFSSKKYSTIFYKIIKSILRAGSLSILSVIYTTHLRVL